MAKQLSITIASVTSETLMSNILEAQNVPKSAAEVIRDANGRVVMVNIKLPSTAAAAAKAALLATPGVAGVQVSDLLPGTTGIDCTSLQQTLDAGFDYRPYPDTGWTPTFTDGKMGIECPAGMTYVAYQGTNAQANLSFTVGTKLEVRVKLGSLLQSAGGIEVTAADGKQQYTLDVFPDQLALYMYPFPGPTPPPIETWRLLVPIGTGAGQVDVTQFHTYTVEAGASVANSGDAVGARLFVDGVLKGTLSTATVRSPNDDAGNIVDIAADSSNSSETEPGAKCEIDFIRWGLLL